MMSEIINSATDNRSPLEFISTFKNEVTKCYALIYF